MDREIPLASFCNDSDSVKQTDWPGLSSEDTLVANASRGDLEAFNELVLQYQNLVYRYAYFIVTDPDLADDIAQDSFIKAFRGLAGFHGGSFRAWLLKIVSRVALDLLRRIRLHPALPLYPQDESGDEWESPVWLVDPTASVQETVERREETTQLYEALQQLPAAYRIVLTLIDLYDLDYQEAAEALSIPIGTIKSRLARARLQMRETITSWEERPMHPGTQPVF
jgi:RNA polymerase sigma-70 factor, ECF subfamily